MLSRDGVAVLAPSNRRNGGNRVLFALANELAVRGYLVSLFYVEFPGGMSPSTRVRHYTCPPIPLSRVGFLVSLLILSIRLWVSGRRFSCVVLSDPIQAIILRKLTSISVIRYVQSDDYLLFDEQENFPIFFNRIYKTLFLKSQTERNCLILFNSIFVRERYNSYLERRGLRCEGPVINPPVFNSSLKYRRRPIGREKVRIAVVMSKHPRKGFARLVQIVNSTSIENLEFVVVSQSDFGFRHRSLVYSKPTSDFRYLRCLGRCQIILNLSSFEGFGLPLLEGMAMGLIAVSVDNGGMRDYFDPGAILKFESVYEFDEIINSIRDKNIDSTLSSQGYQIASGYSVTRFGDKFEREMTAWGRGRVARC